jgi:sodium transport system permease protein
VGASILAGLSTWAVAATSIRLMPPPESFMKAMQKVLLLDDPTVPIWIVWALVALLPAICEELFFRGFLLSGLREWGMWPALGVSAVLFGFAHASIYRFLPTAVLGLVTGYVVWRTRSVFCGMIVHGLNNGIAVAIAKLAQFAELQSDRVKFLPWKSTLAGAVVLAIAMVWVSRSTDAAEGNSRRG